MRKTVLSLVVASILGCLSFTTPARAQTPAQPGLNYGPQGYVSGEGWRYYPPGSIWQGYYPGTAWRGYAPPVVITAPPATTGPVYQPPVAATVPPSQGFYPQVVYPQVTYVPRTTTAAPSGRSGRRTVAPAYYREFGTGRNIFMHKPWLPNQ